MPMSETVRTQQRLMQVKLPNIVLGKNLSRANIDHTENSIRALANQIVSNDFWNPPIVTVSAAHRSEENRKYTLIAGYRRMAAANLLSIEGRLPDKAGDRKGVWVYVVSETQAKLDSVNALENICKENLSSYQTAHTFAELQEEHGYDNRALSEKFGHDRKTVSNYIRAAKNLIPPIQHAWVNFENSPHPIGLTKLIAWASLTPEQQAIEFEASPWCNAYKRALDAPSLRQKGYKKSSYRRLRETEQMIATSTNLYHIEALEWVIGKRDTLDGQSIDDHGDHRNDRRNPKRRNRDTTSTAGPAVDETPTDSTRPTSNGSRHAANRSSSGLWANEGRKPNGTPDTSEEPSDSD